MNDVMAMTDVEGPWRTSLRGNLPVLGNRVFLALPEQCSYPALEFSLLDGGADSSEAPLAHALVTHSVWSTNRADAATVAWQLWSLLTTCRSQPMGPLMLLGANVVTGPLFRSDPDKFARYIVDTAVSVRIA